MSIPPLVCSTPPPPEICVEEDPDDFDLQYNLSQEDYDAYDNDTFSSYTHFQSSQKPEINESTVTPINKNEIKYSIADEVKGTIGTVSPIAGSKINDNDLITNNIKAEVKLNEECVTLEEDSNIEDLDLKLDETTEALEVRKSTLNEELPHVESVVTSNIDRIEDIGIETKSEAPSTIHDDFTCYASQEKSISLLEESEIAAPTEGKITETSVFDSLEGSFSENLKSGEDPIVNESMSIECIANSENIHKDDFGEFEDFQFSSCENKPVAVIDNFENPWENQNTDDDFGNFNANFDQLNNDSDKMKENIQLSQEVSAIVNDNNSTQEVTQYDNDDFDDFNEFKSSVNPEPSITIEEASSLQMPVFNVNSTDNEAQLVERLNKVFIDLFPTEISKSDSEIEGKLENHLGETWRHLLETDVRQPYIVNWNNSVGQKTLLKSLCIDSRNILFGPKWNHMPKYATNLSTAPLQPQKQPTLPNVPHTENIEAERSTFKPAASWSDPITSDLQEPCNTDNGNANLTIGPTDLDVFEAAGSSKEGKIYSSTLNVQPLRQINLPDTHIFTPSDSETPRSKTIHYDDSNPPILLPQSVIDISLVPPDLTQTEASKIEHINKKAEEDNDWEFQDFQGAIGPGSTEEEKKSINSDVSFASQVLQPIKAEPSVPLLNWPDPGEVKEAFNDFTDFVSSTAPWTNDPPPNVLTTAVENLHITPVPTTVNLDNSPEVVSQNYKENNSSQSFNDDFNTFQSAVPSDDCMKSSMKNQNLFINSVSNSSHKITPFVSEFSDNSKAILASPVSINLSKNITLEKNIPTQSSVPPIPNILQPTPVTSNLANLNQQKSGQILQPLSLENYSQINWPSPGIDLQDLSRFNPVETLQSLKSDLSVNSQNKGMSPAHGQQKANQTSDDDIWGEFVCSKPTPQTLPKKSPAFGDDDEWTDFISSPSVKSKNGLNTISLNVHTSLNIQKSSNVSKFKKNNSMSVDIPSLNYITPKSSSSKSYKDIQFQNL